jgi:hypothetical protein
LVEPEELRDPEVQVLVRRLVRLVAVVDLVVEVTSHGSRSDLSIRDSGRGDRTTVLTHATVPSSTLIGRDAELAVEDISVVGVAIEQVRVDLETSLLEETLTRVLAVTVEDDVRSTQRTRAGRSVRRGRRRNDNVGDHISKEVTILRDRELNLRTKRNVVGRDLEVLERDSNIRLEVSVHEQNVRTLKVRQRRVRVGLTRGSTTSLDRCDVVTKRIVTDQHLVHPTIVRYENENPACRHNEGCMGRILEVLTWIAKLEQACDWIYIYPEMLYRIKK